MGFCEKNAGTFPYIASDQIGAVHAFTTRLGGVSRDIWRSMNLGLLFEDNERAVRDNYGLLCSALELDPKRLVRSRQVHGSTVRTVTQEDCLEDVYEALPYEADALITNAPGLALIIYMADCIPILLWDDRGKAVGAVHAGWRSTVLDIAGGAVREMESRLGAARSHIRAAIGPGIEVCCFETDSEVTDGVYGVLGQGAGAFITERNGKYAVDLKGVNRALLTRAGILPEHIDVLPECTCCLPEKYWSHRRTGKSRGSMAAVIMMKERGCDFV